ncbi:MAG: Amidohydrolase, partial [Candidatus Hydrogenedentes bacterium]|nr:Amidohydrolase [Candidatus Hydrogenedentota bacterium]
PARPESPSASGETAPAREYAVYNAHEHLYLRAHLDKYLAAAADTGVVRTLFVASPEFTLRGGKFDKVKGMDVNTQLLLDVAREFPDKIVPFCAVHPGDPEKLEKIKQYVAQGVKGLKLYTGHGNFWDRPLDCDEMLPVYAYCEETNLPICWHVNITRYGDEFERVMKQFPKMTVIVPHFGVTFYRPTDRYWAQFDRLMDTYPNLYTDTSFGTRAILVHGLEVVSRNREIFRAFFEKYSDRILFGTDMVITANKEKTREWIALVLQACRDVLEKDTYRFAMAAKGSGYELKEANNLDGDLRGLALPDEILRKVYETNFERLFPSK